MTTDGVYASSKGSIAITVIDKICICMIGSRWFLYTYDQANFDPPPPQKTNV